MNIDLKRAKRALAKAQKAVEQLEALQPSGRAGAAAVSKGRTQTARKRSTALAQMAAAREEFSDATGAAARPPATTAKPTLDDFFAGVADGVVKAQQAMDDRTRDYLAGIAGKPYLLPSVFRIPKLTASVKFAFETVQKEKVGLIFYSDETTSQTQNQQSIEFDIVSAPLSPGTIALPFAVAPAFEPNLRGTIFDRLLALAPAGSPMLDDRDRVILIANGSDRHYYILYAAGGAGNVGAWHADFSDPPRLLELRRYGAAGDAAVESFRSLIAAQGDAQKSLLAKLG